MKQEHRFDNPEDFLHKLKDLIKEGVNQSEMDLYTPYFIPGLDAILKAPGSKLKFFTLTGAVTGFTAGAGLTCYSVIVWPLITAGKPFISIPPFLIICFELTILLGAIFSLMGLLILGRLPSFCNIAPAQEYGNNEFIIVINKEEKK